MIACRSKYNLEHCNTVTNPAGRRVWGFMGIEAVARPHINEFSDASQCTYRRTGGTDVSPLFGTYVRSNLPENTPYMEICHCRSTETGLIFKPYFWTKWKTKRSFLWSNMISRNHVSLKREPLLRNGSRFHRFKQRHTVSKTRRCRPVGRTS